MRDNLASWLVVSNHARWWWINAHPHGLSIDLDVVAKLDALTNVRRLCIYRNAPFQDQLLHFKARTQSSLGQHFMQLWRFGLCQQHPLGGFQCHVLFIRVELARNYLVKPGNGPGRFSWGPRDLLGHRLRFSHWGGNCV